MEPQEIVMVDPSQILADANIRFGLKKTRINMTAQSILDEGGILVPLELEPLDEPIDGKAYRLTDGHYRLAAAEKLNKDQNAGLLVPAVIFKIGDKAARIRRQLAFNGQRENQTPMDEAFAINEALEAGIPKVELRKAYSRPGGRKGNTVQPASNSFINMRITFLDFPKDIQNKIHNGELGVAAAYELTKSSKEKWQSILDRAEADRVHEIEAEEKAEEKFVNREKQEAEKLAKQGELTSELEKAKVAAEEADKVAAAKADEAAAAYKALKTAKDKDAKAAAEAAFKAKEAESKEAEKVVAAALKAAEKLETKVQSVTALAAEKAKRLKAAQAASKKKGPTPAGIKKAAKDEGEPATLAPLTRSDIIVMVKELRLAGSYPKVKAIGDALHACISSEITNKQLYSRLAEITGEKVAKKQSAA